MYIFDLDGTLLDSNGLWQEVDREFLTSRGLTPTREYELGLYGLIFPTAAAYTKEFYHLDESAASIMADWEGLAARLYGKAPLKPGAAALLEQYRGAGRPMALFTACRPRLCRLALERHDIAGYFSQVIYAEELGMDKHDPRCFTRLSGLLGAAARDCVLIDDSPSNCLTARAAGMRTVGVYDLAHNVPPEDFKAACDRYILSLEELLDEKI